MSNYESAKGPQYNIETVSRGKSTKEGYISAPLPGYTGDRARYPVGPTPYYQESPLMFGIYSKVQKYV